MGMLLMAALDIEQALQIYEVLRLSSQESQVLDQEGASRPDNNCKPGNSTVSRNGIT